MQEIFYLDLYFLINFSLDALAFFTASRILPKPIRLTRLLSASALGAFSACLTELFIPFALFDALLGMTSLILGCFLLFKPHNLNDFLRSIFFSLFSLILLGGSVSALQSLAGIASTKQKIGPFTLLFFGLIGGICIAFGRTTKQRFSKTIQNLCMRVDKAYCYATALVDSGNLLIHPRTGLSVALISYEAANFLFHDLIRTQTQDSIELSTPAGHATFFGFIVEESYIQSCGKKRKTDPFFLAIDRNTRHFGGCDMLISPSILPSKCKKAR